jgi:hypothetical protein
MHQRTAVLLGDGGSRPLTAKEREGLHPKLKDEASWRALLRAQNDIFLAQKYTLTAPQLRRSAMIERFLANEFPLEAQKLIVLADRKAREGDPYPEPYLKAAQLGDLLASPVAKPEDVASAMAQLAPDSRWIRLAHQQGQDPETASLILASLFFAPGQRDVERMRQDFVTDKAPVKLPKPSECVRAIDRYRIQASTAFVEFELGDAVCQWRGALAVVNGIALSRFDTLTAAQLRRVATVEKFIAGTETALSLKATGRAEKLEVAAK